MREIDCEYQTQKQKMRNRYAYCTVSRRARFCGEYAQGLSR
nr:MAG TPA: hypothetical protein [Caudoviricetes sp.]